MRLSLTSPSLWLTACGLVTVLTGCGPKKSGTETASGTTTGTAKLGEPAASSDKVPITTESDEARTLYIRGRDLADQTRAHDARQLLEQAAAKDPTFALVHYDLALNSPTAKEFYEHLKQAVALSSKASEGERLMILSLQAGADADSKKSLEYAEELVARYPRDERAHVLLGVLYSNQQDFSKSIPELTKAIEINPNYSPAYNLLGYAYMPLEKYPDAERAFKKYIELVPNDPNPYDSYAEMLMKTGRFDESIAQYQKALSVDPHFSNSFIGIATNMMLQGKHDQAAAEAQKLYDAARDDGDRRSALFARSVIYVDAGKTAAALKEIEKEYALDAKLADTANMGGDALSLGNILLEAGKPDEAAKRFRQASDLVEKSSLSADVKEDNQLADHYNKARVALAKGDIATAKKESEQYTSGAAARNNIFRIREAHELSGTIALKEKDYDGAINHLGQGNQQDPQVIYWTALAYQAKGDTAKAKEWAAKAANANVLSQMTYAFVREKAKKME